MTKFLIALGIGLLRPILETSDCPPAPFLWSMTLLAALAGCAIFAEQINISFWVLATVLFIIVATPLTRAELDRRRQLSWLQVT